MIFNDSKYNKGWGVRELSELGEFSRGKSKHRPRNDTILFKDGTYPFIQTGDIRECTLYISEHSVCYNETGLKQSKLWPKGTLCVTIAANIAETGILAYPMCFPDSIVGFNAHPKLSSELFMHYVFSYIKQAIQKSTSGSIQDNINIDYLQSLKFRIPEKSEQDRISNVLSSIDEKIENNTASITKIENIIQAIYEYWFHQYNFPDERGDPYQISGGELRFKESLNKNVPANWKSLKLNDLISRIGTGLNPRSHFKLGTGSNYYVTIKNIDNGRIILDDKCDMIDDEALKIIDRRSDLQPGDTLFTSIEPVGVTNLIIEKPKNWNINESVFTLRPNTDYATPEYLYALLSSREIKAFTKNVSAGSVHKGIRHEVLRNFTVPYGGRKIIEKFSERVRPMLLKIHKMDIETRELKKLRTELLPILMTGQVKVKDAA